MKRNIVSDKFKIYYKMNQQNLRYNMLIPYILMIIISWIFCIGQFGINSYLYNNFYNTIDKRTIAVSISNENNADNLYSSDCFSALTGPVARCDIGTVEKHLSVLSREEALVYGILSRELIEIVSGRNEYNYDELSELIKKNSSVI